MHHSTNRPRATQPARADRLDLARRAKAGSSRAIGQLIADHAGLVRDAARRVPHARLIPPEDLGQIGARALLDALRTYDPDCGLFSTWAYPVVRTAVRDAARLERRNRFPNLTDCDRDSLRSPDARDDGRAERLALLAVELALLPARSRLALAHLFGLGGKEPLTLEGVGKKLGGSRQLAFRLREAGLDQLRRRLGA